MSIKDLPDYEKRIIIVIPAGSWAQLLQVDLRQILGLALITPTIAGCVPVSIERTAIIDQLLKTDEVVLLDKINPTVGGEQIVNGGFEDGGEIDFPPWTGNFSKSTQYAHAGTYSVYGANANMQQDLAVAMPVSYLTSLSFWTISPFGTSGEAYIRIIYTDATYTDITITKTDSWAETSVTASDLTAGKTIASIYFFNAYESPMWIDDVSLTSAAYSTVIDYVKEVGKITSLPSITIASIPAMDLAKVLGAALAHDNPVITRLTDGLDFIDPRSIRELTAADIVGVIESVAAGLKVDIKTDTLGGLKILEKNATGVKFDLVTDTLAGLKVVEKNATGMKVDLVTDTLAGLKVLEKNATGIKVDLVTDTLAGLKVTQATRTNLLAKTEREDLTSLGGTASPNNAGVQLIAPNGTKKVKVYDAGFCGAVDGTHYFYFGTDTNATTKRFCTINKLGVMHQTFVQPRVSAASDGLYLFSSVSETNMPYDVGYVLE